MIKFIDIRYQVDETARQFAFYSSLSKGFLTFNGSSLWERESDFVDDFHKLTGIGGQIQRYLDLIPARFKITE